MHAEDLVTSHLAPPQADPSVMEIFRSLSRMSPADCLQAMQDYRESLDEITRNNVLAETAKALLALRGLEEPFHTLYFMYALDYQEEGNVESLRLLREGADEWIRRIEKAARETKLDAALGSQGASLSYLQNIWGEETAELLSTLTGKRLSSAKRWLRGGPANEKSAIIIYSFARCVYLLKEDMQWSSDQVKQWSSTKRESGYTIIEGMRRSLLIMFPPEVLENYIRRIASNA